MSTSATHPPEPYPPGRYLPEPEAAEPYTVEPHPPEVAYTPDEAQSAQDESALRAAWWLALGGAVTSLVLGVMMIAWPEATLNVIAALFGIWLLLHGVVRLVQAVTGSSRDGAERALVGVIGLLFVIAGVIALRNLLASLAVVVTVVGLVWLIGGIVELVSAFNRGRGGDRTLHVVLGGLSIVGALVVLLWPALTLTAAVYVIGAWMVLMGLVQVVLVVQARRAVTA